MPAEWPPLRHPHTRARLAAPDADLYSFMPAFAELLPEVRDAASLATRITHAFGYPWERPAAAGIVRGDTLLADGELTDGQRRYDVLAIGANASPARLAEKFRHLPPADLRVVPGELHDFDVCAEPILTRYGSFAGGLVARPGTRARVTVLSLTAAQVEWLTLSEFGYHFGRLDEITLTTIDGQRRTSIYAYHPRGGFYGVEGAPVALAAVPAAGRSLRAMTQRELLTDCAQRLLGPASSAEALLEAYFADPAGFTAAHYPALQRAALSPPLPNWVAHPLR